MLHKGILWLAAAGGLTLLATAALAQSAGYSVPAEDPSQAPGQAKQTLQTIFGPPEDRSQGALERQLAKAQCGGWKKDVSVAGSIAVVKGAPGKDTWGAGRALTPGEHAGGMLIVDPSQQLHYPADTENEGEHENGAWGLSSPCSDAFLQNTLGRDPATEPLCTTPDDCMKACDALNTDADTEATGAYSCTGAPVNQEGENRKYDDEPNCKVCTGEECRCPRADGKSCALQTSDGTDYRSFFRRYNAVTSRPQRVLDGEISTKRADIGCYGIYEEFDPRDRKTEPRDQRCVINIDLSDLPDAEKGKGEFGTQATPDEEATNNPNARADASFDPAQNAWFGNVGGGFSFLNEKLFTEKYHQNLSFGLLDATLDDASMKVLTPPPKRLLRAFDESGPDRTLTTWWQQEETTANTIFTPPVVHLLLPAQWGYGISPGDPLFAAHEPVADKGAREGRMQPIEVQIDARPDLLGELTAFLQRQLLARLEEKPVPVVVPLASPVELRALADKWCLWVMETTHTQTCDNAPGKMKTLMERLRTYADNIEQVRDLRATVAQYLGSVLTLQRTIATKITSWAKENQDAFTAFLEKRQSLLSLQDEWKKVEAASAEANAANEPFCMNQRFTDSLYELLDPWMPGRDGGGGGAIPDDASLRLEKLGIDPGKDLVIDLSRMRFLHTMLIVPVLKPVQIKLRLAGLSPPALDVQEPDVPDLPDLPSMDAIESAMRQAAERLPSLSEGGETPPIMEVPSFITDDEATAARETFAHMTDLWNGMRDAYRVFWGNMLTAQHPELDQRKTSLTCDAWGTSPCVFTEGNLLQILRRVGSRPMVLLQEDLASNQSLGKPRVPPAECPASDYVCQRLNGETTKQSNGWLLRGQDSLADGLDRLRGAIRDATLPEALGTLDEKSLFPYNVEPKELVPANGVPDAIDLTIPPEEP